MQKVEQETNLTQQNMSVKFHHSSRYNLTLVASHFSLNLLDEKLF